MSFIRAVIGSSVLIFMNGFGLMLAVNYEGFLKWIGSFYYLASGVVIYFLAYMYMQSDFFKSLGKEVKR